MAKDRQKNAYIRNKEHLEYANLNHYKKAISSNDLSYEEYYVQSVLNKPSHANNLKREVFQKKIRNNVTNRIDTNTIIEDKNSSSANYIRSQEFTNDVTYSRVTEKNYLSSYTFEPNVKLSLMYTIEEILKYCTEDQIKVLAYFIVREKIDGLVIDDFFLNKKFDDLRVYILQIWDLNVSSINSLNEFIGSKSKAEMARKSLSKLLKEKFPLLSNI